jgi:CubicO group peptidase (beta-lactamase class C family)
VRKVVLTLFAFIGGLLVGAGAIGLFWWAYASVMREDARDPLANLAVPEGPLTLKEAAKIAGPWIDTMPRPAKSCVVVMLISDDETRCLTAGTLPNGTAPDQNTLFELASLGKTFTGVLLADAVKRGEVTLSTPVTSLLPQGLGIATIDGQTLTLLDIATHTSGLRSLPENFAPKDEMQPYRDYTPQMMMDGLRRTKLDSEPGKTYRYSNFGFGLLGHGLAQNADRPFEELAKERLFEPLGMRDTVMTLSDDQRERVAPPFDGDKPVEVWEDTTMPGAGSFLGTGADLARYLSAYWQARPPLEGAMKVAMRKWRTGAEPADSLGLAWHIRSENAMDIRWHTGSSAGTHSYVAMVPEKRIAVAVLANGAQAEVDVLGRKLIYLLAKTVKEPQFHAP